MEYGAGSDPNLGDRFLANSTAKITGPYALRSYINFSRDYEEGHITRVLGVAVERLLERVAELEREQAEHVCVEGFQGKLPPGQYVLIPKAKDDERNQRDAKIRATAKAALDGHDLMGLVQGHFEVIALIDGEDDEDEVPAFKESTEPRLEKLVAERPL